MNFDLDLQKKIIDRMMTLFQHDIVYMRAFMDGRHRICSKDGLSIIELLHRKQYTECLELVMSITETQVSDFILNIEHSPGCDLMFLNGTRVTKASHEAGNHVSLCSSCLFALQNRK